MKTQDLLAGERREESDLNVENQTLRKRRRVSGPCAYNVELDRLRPRIGADTLVHPLISLSAS